MSGAYTPAQKHEANYNKDQYFGTLDTEDCVSAIIDRVDAYYNEMLRTGRHSLYKNAHIHYLQGYASRGFIANTGALGELSSLWVNHYRTLIQHSLGLVCQERLSWDPHIAGENSWDAMQQIKKARSILEYYADRVDMDLDGVCREGVELHAVFGDGWITCFWDKYAGRPVATEDGFDVKEGDIDVKTWDPFNVIFDVSATDYRQCQWVCIRELVNKFDECAKHPEWAEEIKNLSESLNTFRRELVSYSGEVVDLIYKYHFIHKKTASCPEGREIEFITDEIILADEPLDYDEFPVIRVAASKTWGTPFGYSKFFDNLPLQDAIDRLTSSSLTNELTFGVQNLLVPNDAHINHSALYGGLHVIKYDATKGNGAKPEALMLQAPSDNLNKSVDRYTQSMGTIAGVNDAVTGNNPDIIIKGQASGAALALLTTNAISFNSDLQKAWIKAAESLGTCIVKTLAKKAVTPRYGMAKLGGVTQGFKFQGSDLDTISNVTVRLGPPLLQSQAGKLQVVENLIQANVGISKQDVIGIINGQPLSSILENEEAELMLIQDENERMLRGEQIPPAAIDEDHVLHIKKHKAMRSSVAMKQDPKLMQVFLQHEQSHIEQLTGNMQHGPMNPVLAGLLNQPVIPPGTTPGTLETAAPAPGIPAKLPMNGNPGNLQAKSTVSQQKPPQGPPSGVAQMPQLPKPPQQGI